MAYFWFNLPTDNVAPNATWAAEASGDPNYPASNIPLLTDLNRGNPGKLTIVTAGGWTANFTGGAQRVDIVVLEHNADAGQTVQIQGNATNSWGAPTLSTTLTLPAKREDGFTYQVFADLRQVAGYSTGGFAWWRIHFPVAGPNNSQNWGLKAWMGSIVRVLDRPMEQQLHNTDQHQFLSLATDFGYVWRYDLQGAPRVLTGKINLRPDTSWANMLSLYRAAAGPVLPLLLIPDPTVNDAWFARFGAGISDGVGLDKLDVQRDFPSSAPLTVSFEEVTIGGPEWT